MSWLLGIFRKNRDVAYRPWEMSAWERVWKKAELRLSKERVYTLLSFLQYACCFDGDVIEMGVYKGCTAYAIGAVLNTNAPKGKTLYLCDTFSGTPDCSDCAKGDIRRAGKYADTSVQYVADKMAECYQHTVFVEGFIPDSLQQIDTVTKFCFAHVHLNLYESTKAALLWLKDRMTVNGIVVVEDYGIKNCAGVREAVDELAKSQRRRLVYLPTGQAILLGAGNEG